MDQSARDAVTFLFGTFISACVLVGLAVRYVLLPYLRDHLIQPVNETHKQVTENHHAQPNGQPTVLDRIDDVQRDVKALSVVMDAHMEWSDRWTGLWEGELTQLRQQVKEKGTESDEQQDSTTEPPV